MDESGRRRMTFSLILSPAHRFLQCLIAIRMMATSAVFIVRKAEIQVLVISQDRKSISTLLMEASTASSSWSPDHFAFLFGLTTWIQLLRPPIFDRRANPLKIYKTGTSNDLYTVAGNGPNRVHLGMANFVQERGIDIRRLAHHPVTVKLQSDCFTDVLSAFSDPFEHVMMMAFKDGVMFRNARGNLTYQAQNGQCRIRGVAADEAAYLLIEWRQAKALRSAALIAPEVEIIPLVGPRWMDWVLFNFTLYDKDCLGYMVKGSDVQIVHPGYYGGR